MKLTPKNWHSFQHYKDRNPPWVKLHKTLLDDRDFSRLPIASKALAPMLWLLASESRDGTFDGSIEEIAFRLRWSEKDVKAGLKPLIDKGLFFVDSGMLADCLQDACPETEAERETKTETKTYTEGFDLFWNTYDKKIGKPNSLKIWNKIAPTGELLQKIIEMAEKDKKSKPNNQYRKDPERWLKGQHWEDEIIVTEITSKYLPLGTDKQIEEAYRVECGGDPARARFNSYFEMKKFILDSRDKRAKA